MSLMPKVAPRLRDWGHYVTENSFERRSACDGVGNKKERALINESNLPLASAVNTTTSRVKIAQSRTVPERPSATALERIIADGRKIHIYEATHISKRFF